MTHEKKLDPKQDSFELTFTWGRCRNPIPLNVILNLYPF